MIPEPSHLISFVLAMSVLYFESLFRSNFSGRALYKELILIIMLLISIMPINIHVANLYYLRMPVVFKEMLLAKLLMKIILTFSKNQCK